MAVFGRYELIRPIARGGMAEVWAGRIAGPEGFQKLVAIKKVLPELSGDLEFLELFIAEAKLVAGMEHPNIVQVLDFGRTDDAYFLAMEYVEGTSLAGLLASPARSSTRIPLEVCVYIAYEASLGLAHAHARTSAAGKPLGIVHRDISPQNLLLSLDGQVKLADFGIAKATVNRSQTAVGHVRGKLGYMAPEQVLFKPVDARTDLFALGNVLYEMVSGRRLYGEGRQDEVYPRVVMYAGLTPSMLAGVPESVAEVLATALEADPEARYQSAEHLRTALGGILGLSGLHEARQHLATLVRRNLDQPALVDPSALIRVQNAPTQMEPPSAEVSRTAPRPALPSALLTLDKAAAAQSTIPEPSSRARTAAFAAVLVLVAASSWVLRGIVEGPRRVPVAAPTAVVNAAVPLAAETPAAPILLPEPESTVVPAATAAATATAKVAAKPAKSTGIAGRVSIKAKPWAEVWIDDATGGQTPWDVSLPAGSHRFRFVSLDGTEFERELAVPADGTLTIEIDTVSGRLSVSDGVGTWIVSGKK